MNVLAGVPRYYEARLSDMHPCHFTVSRLTGNVTLSSWERFNHDLVDVTPSPVLARLERSHDRVLGLSEVFGGVFVLRRVAAADVTTNLAKAQMNPRIAHL
jgi:hypothetical protein